MTQPGGDLRERFISGMGHTANTVNVVTTDGPAGRAGVTVSAMSSVSADTSKPTLLVCIHHLSPSAAAILENGVICVNILRDSQSYISDTFAGRFKDQVADKFDCAEWTAMSTGAPRVVDPLVAFDCKIASSERVGTHHVIFGEVEEVFIAETGSPLIYSNRAYGVTSRIESAASISAGIEASERKLSIGCFSTFAPYILPELIERFSDRDSRLDFNLIEGDQRRVLQSLLAGEIEAALMYDLYLPDELDTVTLAELTPYVLLAKDHPLAKSAKLSPQNLADSPMVLLTAPPSPDYFQSIMRDAGVEPKVAFRSESLEMVRGLVGRGLGYALLTTKPATTMTYDGRELVSRPLIADVPRNRVVIATHKRRRLSRAAEAFRLQCLEFFGIYA